MPEMPAPMMTTSWCSVMAPGYQQGVESVNTLLRISTGCKVMVVTAANQIRTHGRRPARPTGDDREAAILATAERLLEQKPLADISVDDLARGAGISRPTFYFYFKSKDAVLLSLLEPMIARADAEFDGAVGRLPADPRRVWRSGIKAFFTAFGSHRAVARDRKSVVEGESAASGGPGQVRKGTDARQEARAARVDGRAHTGG